MATAKVTVADEGDW